MSLRSSTKDENGRTRHAGMDGRHPSVRGMRPETSMSPGFQHSMLE
jgi:hypothetical protein